MMPETTVLEKIRTHFTEGAAVRQMTHEACAEPIRQAAQLLVDRLSAGGKLFLCGNGGSAADCQHMAAELVSRMTREIERPGFPVLALTTDTSFLTAFANDYGYEGVFERQLEAFAHPGDVLIGISTSGNSENVVRAVLKAKATGIHTIVLTGSGGKLRGLADIAIAVPSTDTQYVQEMHIAIEHLLCFFVEHTIYGPLGS